MRRSVTNWWINFFKDLRDDGTFNDANTIQCECLKYCFTALIRQELQTFVNEWNLHKIAKSRNSECANGKPDNLSYMPRMHGAECYGQPVSREDVDYCLDNYTVDPPDHGCSTEFLELVHWLKPNVQLPHSHEEALQLYTELCELVRQYED